jgi:hypothetical protein
MKKYLLDPYVISILYQTKTDEQTLAIYNEVMSKLFILILETVKFHLQEKGVSNEEIETIINALNNPEQSELNEGQQAMLKEEAMVKLLTDSIDQFGQIIYDKLLPILPANDRKELHRYLEAADPIVKYNSLAALADLVNVDSEQLQKIDLKTLAGDQAVEEKDDNVEKIEGTNSVPEIIKTQDDLISPVGEASKNITESQQNSNEVESASVMAENIENSKQTINPVGVEIAEQSLGELGAQNTTDQLDSKSLEQEKNAPQVNELVTTPVEEVMQSETQPEVVSTDQPVVSDQSQQPVQDNLVTNLEAPQENLTMPSAGMDQQPEPVEVNTVEGEINVAPVEPQQVASDVDPLLTPTKATIVDDEQGDAPTNNVAENNVNAVNQLQNMGIDLNDVLQQPPQS